MNHEGTIQNFKELLNEIVWSWDFPSYNFQKHEDGYSLNKLFIQRNKVTYKCQEWTLAPGVYEDFERFFEFLKSTND